MRRARLLSCLQDRFVLTTELQHYVAGNTQRVAKLICQKADFEVQEGNAVPNEGQARRSALPAAGSSKISVPAKGGPVEPSLAGVLWCSCTTLALQRYSVCWTFCARTRRPDEEKRYCFLEVRGPSPLIKAQSRQQPAL